MTTKAEKERQKQIQDKCQALLNQMLRDEDNKYCVDCDAKGPRWASWNLGIFLCIRCAGIHRNLGVHISKVKSVNLDTWTPEQVVSLQQMGNSRARAVYEANLPDNFRRPQADSALEAFVRAKYEAKKYIAREWVPPALPKVNWDKELDEEAERAKKKKRESKIASTALTSSGRKVLENVIPQPLPKPSTSPKPQRISQPTVEANISSSTPSQDLLGLDTPLQESAPSVANSSTDDVFTNFLSVTAPVSNQRSAEEDNFFNQPQPQGSGAGPGSSGKLTTDSILALYGKSQPPPPPQSQVNPFPLQGGFMPAGQVPGFHSSPFAVTNGMVPPAQVSVPIQGAMFPSMGIGMSATASNPFYNMAATSVAPPQPVPISYSQGNRLTQQMGTLNLGTPSNAFQPTIPPPVWQ